MFHNKLTNNGCQPDETCSPQPWGVFGNTSYACSKSHIPCASPCPYQGLCEINYESGSDKPTCSNSSKTCPASYVWGNPPCGQGTTGWNYECDEYGNNCRPSCNYSKRK